MSDASLAALGIKPEIYAITVDSQSTSDIHFYTFIVSHLGIHLMLRSIRFTVCVRKSHKVQYRILTLLFFLFCKLLVEEVSCSKCVMVVVLCTNTLTGETLASPTLAKTAPETPVLPGLSTKLRSLLCTTISLIVHAAVFSRKL